MTPREREVLQAVKRYMRAFRVAPTRLELATILRVSRPTVEQHLQALRDQGELVLVKQWRGIHLARASRHNVQG